MAFDINPLGYGFDALEPHVPAASLRHHRETVHRSYINALNRIVAEHPALDGRSIEDILRVPDDVPPAVRQEVAYLGGGHANHQFLWKVVGPQTHPVPIGDLAVAIDTAFGSFATFRDAFERAAVSLGTEGWCFLSLSRPVSGDLEIVALPGNGSVLPIAKPGIMICDLWEHGTGEAAFPVFWNIVDWSVCDWRLAGLRAGKTQL